MLNNSNYIDGSQATELNKLCRDYDKLKAEFERAKADFESARDRIKELCPEKINETSDFLIKIKIVPDGTTLDTDRLKKELPEVYEEFQKTKKGYSSIQEILKK